MALHQLQRSWRIFRGNPFAVIGLILIGIFGIMAIAHPILMKTVWPKGVYDPVTGFDMNVVPHPTLPSSSHLLGTDTLGRDVFSMLLAATTPTFVLGLTAAVATAIAGTLIGVVSAYYGGVTDAVLSRISDVFLLIPAPILMVIVGSRFRDIGPAPLGLIYGTVAGLGTTSVIMRAHALKVKVMPFIEASRTAGGGSLHVMSRHVLPHMLPLAGLQMMIAVTGAVIADGFISFLGMTRNINNWGTIIYNSFQYSRYLALSDAQWHVLVPPSLCLSLFALAFYLVSRGLQDVADPRIAERRARTRQKSFLTNLRSVFAKVPSIEKLEPRPSVLHGRLTAGESAFATILFAKLHSAVQPSHGGSLNPSDSSKHRIRDIIPLISRHRGLVNSIDDSSLIASFGIVPTRVPPQVSALLATHAGLELLEYIRSLNRQSDQDHPTNWNISIGVATGRVSLIETDRSQIHRFPLQGNAVQTAERLRDFTHSIQASGLLVSEETFTYLSPVKDQFTLGRQGMTSFPWEKQQKMVYQIVGRRQPLIKMDASRINFFGLTTQRKTVVSGSDWLAIGHT